MNVLFNRMMMKEGCTYPDSRLAGRSLACRWAMLASIILLLGGWLRPVVAQSGDEFWFDVPEHARFRSREYPVYLHLQNLAEGKVRVTIDLPAEPWDAAKRTGFEPITLEMLKGQVRRIQLAGRGRLNGRQWAPNSTSRELGLSGGNEEYQAGSALCLHYGNVRNFNTLNDCPRAERAQYIENLLAWAKSDVDHATKRYINRTNKGVRMRAEQEYEPGKFKRITGARLISAYLEMGMTYSYDILVLKGSNALGRRFVVPAQMSIPLGGGGTREGNTAPAYSSVNVVATRGHTWVDVYTHAKLFVKENGGYGGKSYAGEIVNGKHHYRLYFARAGQSMILTPYVGRAATPNSYQVPKGGVVNRGLRGTVIEVAEGGDVAVTVHSDDAQPQGNGPDYIGDQLVPVSRYGHTYAAIRGIMGRRSYSGEVLSVAAAAATHVTAYCNEHGHVKVIDGWENRPLAAGEQVDIAIDGYSAVTLVANEAEGKIGVFQVAGLSASGSGQRAGAILPPIPVGRECIGTREVVLTRSQGDPYYVNVLAFVPDATGSENSAIGGFMLQEFNGTEFVDMTAGKGKLFADRLNNPASWKELPYQGENKALGRWKWIQLRMSNDAGGQFPLQNRPYRLKNGRNVFQIGVLHGAGGRNGEFGYFSDFLDMSEGLPVLNSSPKITSEYMVTPEGIRLCYPMQKDVELQAQVLGALSYEWRLTEVENGVERDLTGSLTGADTKRVHFTAPEPDTEKHYYLSFKAKGYCNTGTERRIPLVVGHDVGVPKFSVSPFCTPIDGPVSPMELEVSNVLHADSIRWEVREPFGVPSGGGAAAGHTDGARGKMSKPALDATATLKIPLLFNTDVFDDWAGNRQTSYSVHLHVTAFNSGCSMSKKEEDIELRLAPDRPVVKFYQSGTAQVSPFCPGGQARAKAEHELNGLTGIVYEWSPATVGTTNLGSAAETPTFDLSPGLTEKVKVTAKLAGCAESSEEVPLEVSETFAFAADAWTQVPAVSVKQLAAAGETVEATGVKGQVSSYAWELKKEGVSDAIKEATGASETSFTLRDELTGDALGLGSYTLRLTVSSPCGPDLSQTQTFRIVEKLVPVGFEDGKLSVANTTVSAAVANGSDQALGDVLRVQATPSPLAAGRKIRVRGASPATVDATGAGTYTISGPDKVDIIVGRKVEMPTDILPVGQEAKDGDGHGLANGDPVKDGGTLVLPQKNGDYPIVAEGPGVTGPVKDSEGNNVWSIAAGDAPVKLRYKRVKIGYEPAKVSVKGAAGQEVESSGAEPGKRELGTRITVEKKNLADGEVARVLHAKYVGATPQPEDGTGEYLLNEDKNVEVVTGFPAVNMDEVEATTGNPATPVEASTLLKKDEEITVPKKVGALDVVLQGASGPVEVGGKNVWTVKGDATVVILLKDRVPVHFDAAYSTVQNVTTSAAIASGTKQEKGNAIEVQNVATAIPAGRVRMVHGAAPVAGKVLADKSGQYIIDGPKEVRIVVGKPVAISSVLPAGKTITDGEGKPLEDGYPVVDGGSVTAPSVDAEGYPIVVDGATKDGQPDGEGQQKWKLDKPSDQKLRVHRQEVPVTYEEAKVSVTDASTTEVGSGKMRELGSVLMVEARGLKPGEIVRPKDATMLEATAPKADGSGTYRIKKEATEAAFETGFPVANATTVEASSGGAPIDANTLLKKDGIILVPDLDADGKKVEVKGAEFDGWTTGPEPKKQWKVTGEAPVEILVHSSVPVLISGGVKVTNKSTGGQEVPHDSKEAKGDVLEVQPSGTTDGRVVKVHGGRLVAETNPATHAGTYELLGPSEGRVVFGRPVAVDAVELPSGTELKDGDGYPMKNGFPVKDGGALVVPAVDAQGYPLVVDGASGPSYDPATKVNTWTVAGDEPLRVHVKEVKVEYPPAKISVKDDATPPAELGTGSARRMGTLLTVSSSSLATGEIVRLKLPESAEAVSVATDDDGTGTYRLSREVEEVVFETGFPVVNTSEVDAGSGGTAIDGKTLLQKDREITVPKTVDDKVVVVLGATGPVERDGKHVWTVDGDAPVEILAREAVPVAFDKSKVKVVNQRSGKDVEPGEYEIKGDVLKVTPLGALKPGRVLWVQGATEDTTPGEYEIDLNATMVRIVVGKPVAIVPGTLPASGVVKDGTGVNAHEVADGEAVADGGTLLLPALTDGGHPIVVDNAKRDGVPDSKGRQKWVLLDNDQPVRVHVKTVRVEYAKVEVKDDAQPTPQPVPNGAERPLGSRITLSKGTLAKGEVARVPHAKYVGTRPQPADGTGEYLLNEDADVMVETGFPVANEDRVPAKANGEKIANGAIVRAHAVVTVPAMYNGKTVLVLGAAGPRIVGGRNEWTVRGDSPVVIMLQEQVPVTFDGAYSAVKNATTNEAVASGSTVENGSTITVENAGTPIPDGRVRMVHGAAPVAGRVQADRSGEYIIADPDGVRIVVGKPLILADGLLPDNSSIVDGEGKELKDGHPVVDGGALLVPATDAQGYPLVVDGATKDGQPDGEGQQKWVLDSPSDQKLRVHRLEVPVTYDEAKVSVTDATTAEVGSGKQRELGSTLRLASSDLQPGEVVRPKDSQSVEKLDANSDGTGMYRIAKGAKAVAFETGFPVANANAVRVIVDGTPLDADALLQQGDKITVPGMHNGEEVEVTGATHVGDDAAGNKIWRVDGTEPVVIVLKSPIPITFNDAVLRIDSPSMVGEVKNGAKVEKGSLIDVEDRMGMLLTGRVIRVHGGTAQTGVDPKTKLGQYSVVGPEKVRIVVGKPVEIVANTLPLGQMATDSDGDQVRDGDPIVDEGTLTVPAQSADGYPIEVEGATKDGPVDADGKQQWKLKAGHEPIRVHIKEVAVRFDGAKLSVVDDASRPVVEGGRRAMGRRITVSNRALTPGEVLRVENAKYVGPSPRPLDGTGDYRLDAEADVEIRTGFPVSNRDGVAATVGGQPITGATLLQQGDRISVPIHQGGKPIVVKGATYRPTDKVWEVKGDGPVAIVVEIPIKVRFDGSRISVYNTTTSRGVANEQEEQKGDQLDVQVLRTLRAGRLIRVYGGEPAGGMAKDGSGAYLIVGPEEVYIVAGRPLNVPEGLLPAGAKLLLGHHEVQDGDPVPDGGRLLVPAQAQNGEPIVVSGATKNGPVDADGRQAWIIGSGDEKITLRTGRDERPSHVVTVLEDTDVQRVGVQPLRVYPNPTLGPARVEGPAGGETVEVFSALGRRVMVLRLTPDGHLNLEALPRGVYVLRTAGHVGRVVKM